MIPLLLAMALAAKTPASLGKATRPALHPQVRAWLNQLPLERQVAQLVIVNFYGESPASTSKAYRGYERLVRDLGVGGLIVLNRVQGGLVVNAEPHTMAAFLNRMQRAASIPLIVGGDFERGASMRMTSTTKFPHNMAFAAAKDLEGTRFLARQTARESRAMGVHWVFAPDADVNNNADNPVIGLRSFSENPEEVAEHVRAYVEGARSDPAARVLTCAKHFPGHGDTNVDSHLSLARVEVDRARLQSVEFKPFAAAIAAKVDSIMTAHLNVPALEPREIPVTVSKPVMTGVLRGELGFQGLVTTDAMDMYGLSKQLSPGEAAVRALEAGVDVLLIPPDPERAIRAVVAAVNSGRLSAARIRSSVEKVLAAKVALGLHQKRLVDIEKIADVIDSPEAAERAQQTADRALTLVRNEQSVFPLRNPDAACVYVLIENRYSTLGRRLSDELRQRVPRLAVRTLDAAMPEGAFTQTVEDARQCKSVVVASFASAAAFRGDAALALAPPFARLLENLLAGPVPVGLVSFGNPYLLKWYPLLPAYVATFSTASVSEVAVAKALLGEIPFRGKLPVTIPGLADYGTGLTQ